jgi:acyl carrier protein
LNPDLSDLNQKIRSIVASELQLSEARLAGPLTLGDLGLDSLMIVEAVAAIESALACEIDVTRLSENLSFDLRADELFELIASSLHPN